MVNASNSGCNGVKWPIITFIQYLVASILFWQSYVKPAQNLLMLSHKHTYDWTPYQPSFDIIAHHEHYKLRWTVIIGAKNTFLLYTYLVSRWSNAALFSLHLCLILEFYYIKFPCIKVATTKNKYNTYIILKLPTLSTSKSWFYKFKGLDKREHS